MVRRRALVASSRRELFGDSGFLPALYSPIPGREIPRDAPAARSIPRWTRVSTGLAGRHRRRHDGDVVGDVDRAAALVRAAEGDRVRSGGQALDGDERAVNDHRGGSGGGVEDVALGP